jgi:exonuclease III
MTGKSREIVEALNERKIAICCVQETRWRSEGTRRLGDQLKGYKFYWKGQADGQGGVGILLTTELAKDVIEVKRLSARVILVKLLVANGTLSVVSAYAPQTGRPEEEKAEFWRTLEGAMAGATRKDRIMIAGDFNGHVGEQVMGFPETHGGRGVGERNREGERLLEFAEAMNMVVVNTWFDKPQHRLVTYESGDAKTQVDYILLDRGERKHIRDIGVIKSIECVRQHYLLVMKWTLKPLVQQPVIRTQKVRTWKLRDAAIRTQFSKIVEREARKHKRSKYTSVDAVWQQFKMAIMAAAEKVCGISKGSCRERKPWIWNNAVQQAVKAKRQRFQEWYKNKTKANRWKYLQARTMAKDEVRKAIASNAKSVAEKLETMGKHARIFGEVRRIIGDRVDVGKTRQIKNSEGKILSDGSEMVNAWTQYMEKVLNDGHVNAPDAITADLVRGPELPISVDETRTALTQMKTGKAAGGSGITTEMLKAFGEGGLTWLTDIFNRTWQEGNMPEDWKVGIIIPVYKGKGDPLECSSYRPIKLLEHAMKVLEKVIENRLRKLVDIDEMQRGFMPGRCTTDAIFTLRTMIEKHLEKNKELWAAFVDLEKAYDSVPREAIWWALRKQGVNEQLVKAVQVLYKDSKSAVRIMTNAGAKVGQHFEVSAGVHQGSVLSPLLFICVMEEATKLIRKGAPWEMLFADDLAITAEDQGELEQQLEKWKESFEAIGLRVNVAKTKVARFARNAEAVTKPQGKSPCGVCGKGVGANSILCGTCKKWVHGRKCSGLKGALAKVKDFKCKTCTEGPKQQEQMQVGEATFEKVEEFCYLGHVLETKGGVQGAVRARIRSAWANWRKVAPVLSRREVSHKLRGWLYKTTVRSALLYSAETWPVRKEEVEKLERTEMRMLRWMTGRKEALTRGSESIRKTFGLDTIESALRKCRLRWLGHVYRRESTSVIQACEKVLVAGKRPVGRPPITWRALVREDMKLLGLTEERAADRRGWRSAISVDPANPARCGKRGR